MRTSKRAWLNYAARIGFIHKALKEKQMELEYNTVERLRAHPDIAKFIGRVRKRPPGLRLRLRPPAV